MFICIDTNQCTGTGKTLNEAYKNYDDFHGHDAVEDCSFYEAEEIKVEVTIQRVEVVVKAPVKRG